MASIGGNLPREELLEMYRGMLTIRRMEEQLARDCAAGKLPGPVHLYVGEEAIAVGVCRHLSERDWITSTHRGHGHFLAKGGDPARMMAEIYGRADGICGGFGGSMHVADFSKGIIGANGIVGGGIALAAGAALAAQLDGDGRVAVAFFGDGAANQGVLAEALNVAALWKLPLLLVCENNGFSEFSPTATVTAGSIAERARPFGVPSVEVDGNDVVAVWQAADVAVRRAREGRGPSLIEARTYRTRGHVEYEVTFITEPYREEAEVEAWRARDPIDRLARRLCEEDPAVEAELAAIAAEVEETVLAAVRFAEASPEPDPASARGHMFANP
jgi:pyruvate dehydrogenase E1 component alpha subunit